MWSLSRKCCSGGIFFLKGISSHAIPLKNTWFFSSSSDILFSGSFCSNLISTSLKSWLISPIKPFKTSSILVFSMLLCIYSFVSYWLFSNKFLANLSQNINTPMAHKSTFLPQWPYNASGAVYQRVPMKVEMGLFSDTIIFDSPQSVSFTCPQLVTKIFSGLSSRQMMPSECKISIPIIISATNILMMSSVNTHYFLFKQQQISPLGMYSITMQILHSFWKVSLMEANNVFSLIFLILSLCRTLNYFIFRLSIIFIAYWWLFYLSSASTTSPKVPRPRYLMDWQFSAPCLGVWMGPELGVEQPGEDSRILMDVYFLGSVGVGPGVRTFLGFCRGWVYLVYSLQHTTPIFTTLLDASICI